MPSPIMSDAFMTAIRTQPNLPRLSWYLICGVALSALNQPKEIPLLYTHAIKQGVGNVPTLPSHNEKLEISRKLREALIKSSAICGLPKTINSLLELKKATPPSLLDDALAISPSGRPSDIFDTPPSHLMHRGNLFFEKIYGKIATRVMGQMDRSGTEDLGLIARLMYGHILSNTRILSANETSFVLLAGLIPQDVDAQLRGHLKGATHHDNVTVEEIKAVRDVVIQICRASGMQMLDENVVGGWGWKTPVADL